MNARKSYRGPKKEDSVISRNLIRKKLVEVGKADTDKSSTTNETPISFFLSPESSENVKREPDIKKLTEYVNANIVKYSVENISSNTLENIIANYNKEKVSKVDDKLLAQILELYKSTNSKLDTINDKIKINIYTFYMFAL